MSSKGRDPDGRPNYSSGSPLVHLFDSPGKVKILDVFLRKHYTDLPAAEVSRLADISPSTFHRNIDDLVEIGIIRISREIGGTQLYQLDTDNPVAKILGRVRVELLNHVERIQKEGEGESEISGRFDENRLINPPNPVDERRISEGIKAQSRQAFSVAGD